MDNTTIDSFTLLKDIKSQLKLIKGSCCYNNNRIAVVDPGTEYILSDNFRGVHSVAVSVLGNLGDIADVTVGPDSVTLPAGSNFEWTVDTTIKNDITIHNTSTATVIIILITS